VGWLLFLQEQIKVIIIIWHSLLWSDFLKDSAGVSVRALTPAGIPTARSTSLLDRRFYTDGRHGRTPTQCLARIAKRLLLRAHLSALPRPWLSRSEFQKGVDVATRQPALIMGQRKLKPAAVTIASSAEGSVQSTTS
jgi:hypothetical protein